MDFPAPTSQTYIHGDLKFVSNNFVSILEKYDVPEAFHIIQDFLATSPIGFTHGVNTFHITRDVIVKSL